MSRSVAFLRAINVGKRRVAMADLRVHLEALGLENVATYIASGNVIFDTPARAREAVEAQVEAALAAALGFEVATMVRHADELRAIADRGPFPEYDGEENSTLYVSFLKAPLSDEAGRELLKLATPIDRFALADREFYWLFRRDRGESGYTNPMLEHRLGVTATRRNISTVRRIVAKYLD